MKDQETNESMCPCGGLVTIDADCLCDEIVNLRARIAELEKDKARMFDLVSRIGVAIKKYFDHPLWDWVPHLDALLDEIEDISLLNEIEDISAAVYAARENDDE